MSVDLYYMPLSSPCRAIMLLGKELGIEVNLKLINLLAGEHMTPEFLKMNKQHTIPTMEDNGFFLNESRAILLYLQNKYGKNESLYPSDPVKRYAVDQKLFFDMGTLYSRFAEAYYPMIFYGGIYDGEKMKKFEEALQWTEEALGESAWIAGNDLTLADFTIIASLSTAECVGHDLSPFKNIVAYMDKCKDTMKSYNELNQVGCDQFGGYAKSKLKDVLPA